MIQIFDLGLFTWFLLILINVKSTTEHEPYYLDTHREGKQMSLESCLGRFDVHGNTIIRTGESQAIGGKFLQGLELETPEKCQRLCCETSDCDVYVFEEKNDGYCYLFQCGSPKNFHCKFTRHANYTSALLTQFKSIITTTPRPNIHVPLINISTQEQELFSLKIKPTKLILPSTIAPIISLPNENMGMVAVAASETRNVTCGRFEFPCHSGECIAVYNACNGIPQCADGSDEGPECSDATNNNNKPSNSYQQIQKVESPEVSIYRQNYKNSDKLSNDVRMNENRHSSGSSPTLWIDQKVEPDLEANSDDTNPNMKSTKTLPKNILNLDRTNIKPLPNQREMYAQLPDIKSSFPTPQNPQPTAHIFNENPIWPQQRQHWQHATKEPLYSVQMQSNNIQSENNRIFPISSDTRAINEHLIPKGNIQNNIDYSEKNSEYADYSEKIADTSIKTSVPKNETPKPKTSVKKTPHPAFAEQYKVIEQHLEFKFTDHDGLSEKPRGAVLSLTLGLLVTAIIVVLIGCRVRTVGRRGIRLGGKAPYAPDEDFLVNGMYL